MKFTISITAYNRKQLLENNLNHLEQLNFDKKMFEVIVVDDGSTDGTSVFMNNFIKKSKLQIHYYKKNNGGKHSALKLAIEKSKGDIFINSDSDDYLNKDSLKIISEKWSLHKIEEQNNLAGLIGQNLNIKTLNIIGNANFKEGTISDPILMRFRNQLKGDKIPVFKTNILKEYNFPSVNQKIKFIPESYILYGISSKYQFVYTKETLQHCNYEENGLTANIQKYRRDNAEGVLLVYKKYVELISINKTIRGYIRNYINYIRFSLLSNKNFSVFRILDLLLIPFGFAMYFKDKILK